MEKARYEILCGMVEASRPPDEDIFFTVESKWAGFMFGPCPSCGEDYQIATMLNGSMTEGVRWCGDCGTIWYFNNGHNQMVYNGKSVEIYPYQD